MSIIPILGGVTVKLRKNCNIRAYPDIFLAKRPVLGGVPLITLLKGVIEIESFRIYQKIDKFNLVSYSIDKKRTKYTQDRDNFTTIKFFV